jgi:hypothetical protein
MNRFKITVAMLGLLTTGFAPSMKADADNSGLEFSAKALDAGHVARSKKKGPATGTADGASGTP